MINHQKEMVKMEKYWWIMIISFLKQIWRLVLLMEHLVIYPDNSIYNLYIFEKQICTNSSLFPLINRHFFQYNFKILVRKIFYEVRIPRFSIIFIELKNLKIDRYGYIYIWTLYTAYMLIILDYTEFDCAKDHYAENLGQYFFSSTPVLFPRDKYHCPIISYS